MRSALAALVCCIAACGKRAADESRYLLVRGGKLVQIAPLTGEAHEVASDIRGRVTSARAVDAGRAVIVGVDAEEAEVWRIEVAPFAAVRLWHGKGPVLVEGASADGSVVAIGFGRILADGKLEELDPPKHARTWSGDVSRDGRRVLISFAPACAGTTLNDCKFEIWGFDREDRTRGWRSIATGPTSAYNPRFAGGVDELAFHVAQADPACPGKPFGCKDIEDTFLVGFAGGTPTLLREKAWTPRYSHDGRWLAIAEPSTRQLLVGDTAGELAGIAGDAWFANSWSPGGMWLAYTREDLRSAVVRRDGSDRRGVGDGHDAGWIAAPLPQGKLAPPTPTAAERSEEELMEIVRAFRRLRREGEPLHHSKELESSKLPADAVAHARTDLERILGGGDRVLVVVPQVELCKRRELTVLARTESLALVTTRRLDGDPADETVREMFSVSRAQPRVVARATFANAIELVGADFPARVAAGERFAMTLHYRVRSRVYSWKTFVHFDAATRFASDHRAAPCPPDYWSPGDTVADRFEVTAGRAPGMYAVYTGFFTGTRNQPVTDGDHEANDRVKLGTIVVE